MFCLGHPNGHAPQGGKNYYDSETRARESVQGGDYEGTVQYFKVSFYWQCREKSKAVLSYELMLKAQTEVGSSFSEFLV